VSTQLQHSLPIIDHTPEPYTGPSREEVLALRHQYLSPGVFMYYKEPLMVVEGHMQYVWDEAGKR
jgi:alanine-glyoxylate transaminase/(R)-3-amino-2-methylpropionate-pyruvate transaminase